jgi:hypothetical protein
MRIKAGDKVRVVCEVIGEVIEDPTKSEFSVLVQFGKEIARLPNDGTLLGMTCLKLVKVEEETYEHP